MALLPLALASITVEENSNTKNTSPFYQKKTALSIMGAIIMIAGSFVARWVVRKYLEKIAVGMERTYLRPSVKGYAYFLEQRDNKKSRK